jgi:drug/metabolite transporter (DMT)-like permease
VNGYFAAAVAVLIWASYPVATRAGVTGSFAPQDLVALRFGVGALLFLPYVMLHWRRIDRAAWLQGVPLTLFQGVGMAALAICGMQLAPANHAAALGPGVNAAWVALLGFLVFARRPSRRAIVGAVLCVLGVLLLAFWSAAESNAAVLAGDAMFLAASALGALYVLQLRTWGLSAVQGAAIVSLYSACVVLPYYLWSAGGNLHRVAAAELLWQILWQGVLFGCVALIALNHAISRLGAERSSADRGAGAGLPGRGSFHRGDGGVCRHLRRRLGRRDARKSAYAGSPAACSAAANRSACGLSRPG